MNWQASGDSNAVAILLPDTVTRPDSRHAGAVLVAGSHGGTIAEHYVAQACERAAIFNDAGRGKDDVGASRLPVLDARGIASATGPCAIAPDAASRCRTSAGLATAFVARLASVRIRPCSAVARALAEVP